MDQCALDQCAAPPPPTAGLDLFESWRQQTGYQRMCADLTEQEQYDRFRVWEFLTACPADNLVNVAMRMADGILREGMSDPRGLLSNLIGALPIRVLTVVLANTAGPELAAGLLAHEMLRRGVVR